MEAEQTSTTPGDATPMALGVRVLCDASRGFVKGAVTRSHLRKRRKIVENVARQPREWRQVYPSLPAYSNIRNKTSESGSILKINNEQTLWRRNHWT